MYHDGCLLVDEAVERLHLHDVPVDFSIADECQTGDGDAFVSRSDGVDSRVVHGRVDVFLQGCPFECLGAEDPQQDSSTADEGDEEGDETGHAAQMKIGIDIGKDEACGGADSCQADAGKEVDLGNQKNESDDKQDGNDD